MASYSAIITSTEVIIAGRQSFKMAASRFVDVSEEEINLMKKKCHSEEYQTRHKVRNDTLQKQDVKNVLNVTKKPFEFP